MSFRSLRVSFRCGFTLMELLVVIAIIALLVSILMPSLQSAKRLARLAVCQSNMHSIAIGNGQYMTDNDGFSVHGRENWSAYYMSAPGFLRDTGYKQSFEPTHIIDNDYGDTKRGVGTSGWIFVHGATQNQFDNGGQNLPGTGGLMYDKYLEESAEAIGCPQADFTQRTQFSGNGTNVLLSHNFQYVKFFMSIPKMKMGETYNPTGANAGDPNFKDPNAYWRNDYYHNSIPYGSHNWAGRNLSSSYVVRGPLLRSGDVLNQFSLGQGVSYYVEKLPENVRAKADSQIALFADHEWSADEQFLSLINIDRSGQIPSPQYPKEAWGYFPRRHIAGPVVGYIDGHAKQFQDETRKKTWEWKTNKKNSNYTGFYGNGWAMMMHIFDE